MDEEAVEEYVERAQSIIDDKPQMGEATTKAAVLQDFLELLGWEIPENTELEYSVKAFGKVFKVDYALVLEGVPVAFLEAKGVDTSLKDEHRGKIQEYMKSEDVNLGILTNGKEYEFFRRQVIDSKVSVESLAAMQLQHLPDRVAILRAFTTDAIQNDEWVKILNRINELKEARNTLEAEKDDLATELTALLTDSISETISSHAESQAKEMIDRLIQDIEAEIDSDGDSSVGRGGELISQPPSSDVQDVPGEYIIKILDDETTLATFGDDTQGYVMTDAVSYLIENHDLISQIEPLPYIPGRKNVIINDQIAYPDEDKEMRLPHELPGGYYLETHNNKEGKKREIRLLVDRCGFDVEFEGGW